MVRHIIVWKLKEEIKEKSELKQRIKESLEGLVGKIPGLIKMKIMIHPFSSSNGDLSMDSYFDSYESLKQYQTNPLHVEIANHLVRPNVEQRLSFDTEEQ
jgi:hypothetical protein